MSTKTEQDTYWNDRATFRTDSEVRGALSTVKNRIGRANRVAFRGRKITEEAVFGALCLWADAQDLDALEAALGPYVAKLEEVVAGRRPKRAEVAAKRGAKGFAIRGREAMADSPSAADPAVPSRAARPKRKSS